MRYCVVCGACLESHNLSLKYCKRPACQDVKKSKSTVESMRRTRRERKLIDAVNQSYNQNSEAA
jgi:hypothetical protein